jgi:hypothetical protein
MKLCMMVIAVHVFHVKKYIFIMADIVDDVINFVFFKKMLMSAVFCITMQNTL